MSVVGASSPLEPEVLLRDLKLEGSDALVIVRLVMMFISTFFPLI